MDPADVIPTHQCLQVYPQLAGLVAIIGAGWQFQEVLDGNGLTALTGTRVYEHMPLIVDGIRITSEDSAYGIRAKRPDGRLWGRDGSLAYVVDGLLNLPDPASPLAPFLITGAVPQLWIPNQHR